MRRLVALIVLGLLGTAVAAPAPEAVAASAPTIVGPDVVGESADFATETFSDPWDYANTEDVVADKIGPAVTVNNPRLSGGRFRFTGPGYWSPHFMTVNGSLPMGRDGLSHPIPAATYNRLSMRVWASSSFSSGVVWFACHEYSYGNCGGSQNFSVQAGWNLIDVELRNNGWSGAPRPYSGDILGMHMNIPTSAAVEVDWLRIHAPGPDVTVSAPGVSTLLWDTDTDTGNNTSGNPGWGTLPVSGGQARFPASAMPPGRYWFADASGGPWSQPLTVEARPTPVIDEPDLAGGEDYATTHLGNPWDFNGPDDVTGVHNSTNVSWSGGELHATNTNGDPAVDLRVGPGGIDASRYHRLTVRMRHEPHVLAEPGVTNARLIWQNTATGSRFYDSEDLVVFNDDIVYQVDLEAAGNAVQEEGRGSWAGQKHFLRWDPNEDTWGRRWHLDDIRLAADDEAADSFDVTWHDDRALPGTTVDIHADRNDRGYDGQRIASGVVQQAGSNRWNWDVRDVAPGRWWLHLRSRAGGQTADQYSTGPVRVSPRLAGASRVHTATELSRNTFDRASAVVIANAYAFPDALSAAPLAAALNGPLLLNPRSRLEAAVAGELRRLDASTVYLMGGPGAQSTFVEQQLEGLGLDVIRVEGVDRFDTAAKAALLANQVWGNTGGAGSGALVALGTNFPDALAAGPLAAVTQRPILLVTRNGVPAATAAALRTLDPERVTVIGGSGAVSADVLAAVSQGRTGDRLWGNDRFHTAAVVADAAVAAGADRNRVLLARGGHFADALGAGPVAAARGGILLLTARDSLPSSTRQRLANVRGRLEWLRVAGGSGAVRDHVVGSALGELGLPD